MKLEKIKIAGFKSFVDPTTIPVPGNLVGIVGPNGCGKSNIIDAVRWVMGESSAKHLRGESMADVIFNGSSARKPVGMASVELIFDNGEGRVGGEYANYNSISIKRQVTRDGQSQYVLNGSRCRRKDITDLFLGTGLGSRSYAIIEQGTISRMVEAKPDELRVFIEEAAGVSKYKERRHETEIRMRHTEENLERLNDLRDEVGKQLKHLERQARKAEKYIALKEEERTFRRQLLAMRWRSYDTAHRTLDGKIQGVADRHNALFSRRQQVDVEIEQGQIRVKAAQQSLNETQAEFYSLVADINRIEQTIQHNRSSREETEREIERLRHEIRQTETDLEHDRVELETIREQRQQLQDALGQARSRESETRDIQAEAELQRGDWQHQWETLKADFARHREQSEVQRVHVQQIQSQRNQMQGRQQRLQSERQEFADDDLAIAIEALEQGIALTEAERGELHARLEVVEKQIREQRQAIRDYREALDDKRSDLQHLRGKIASLELLQQNAMGKDRKGLSLWLEETALLDSPRLAQNLEVESGWEKAVETVLGTHLEALCLDDVQSLMPVLGSFEGEKLSIFETRPNGAGRGETRTGLLLEKVDSPWNLKSLLAGIHCADDLPTAGRLCENLAEHESVITRGGEWLGPGWMVISRGGDDKSGMLQREKELRSLRQGQEHLRADIVLIEQQLDASEELLQSAEVEREDLQRKEKHLSGELSAKHAELSGQTARLEHNRRRLAQIEEEYREIVRMLDESASSLEEAETAKQVAEEMLESLKGRIEALEAEGEMRRLEAEEAARLARIAREEVLSLSSQLENLNSSEALTQKHVERLENQLHQIQDRLRLLDAKFSEAQAPLDEEVERLEQLVVEKDGREKALADQRARLQESESSLKDLTEERGRLEQEISNCREELEKLRMEQEALKVRRQTVAEQLQEMEAEIDPILESLPEEAEETEWQSRVEILTGQIQKLGAINLTAVEEFQEQAERMQFLDEQYEDLASSLSTLEEAIRKIDHESKTRFKETYDQINAGLQKKFPKLFGGGQAYLDLTSDDLLEAGVTIVARPPGKRNSSIHLLSGGEKALTAVALVFSIFDLNPAPFCLLDEVDAPLDDANVGRFSKMVEEMSESVQFLFISHNKVTMEIAKHLAGVTMKEPGVSRIVAVDIDEAVELAAS